MKEYLINEYLIKYVLIEKSKESTAGNVYIISSDKEKYVAKIYDDLHHVNSMINLHLELYGKLNIPKIIKTKNNSNFVELEDGKYMVLYSFLEGTQIGKLKDFDCEIISLIANEVRRFHDLTSLENKFKLKDVPFNINKSIKRYSSLHFDLTKDNIFYDKNNNIKIGFIDFDDAKYGPSICDVSIVIALLFFSKTRGVNLEGVNIFLKNYYKEDTTLMSEETLYIKEIALNWIDYIMDGNQFDSSTRESFIIKRKLVEDKFII